VVKLKAMAGPIPYCAFVDSLYYRYNNRTGNGAATPMKEPLPLLLARRATTE
jgi:hypothetical protein